MRRLIKKTTKKPGLSPGALVHVGEKKEEHTKISLIDYSESQFQEKEIKNIEESFPFKDSPTVTWINIDGLHEVGIIEKIGKNFNLHPLLLEDILNTGQRPKAEDFEDHIFIVSKMLYFEETESEIISEQLSVIIGANFVISFQGPYSKDGIRLSGICPSRRSCRPLLLDT
jgi:magnesium transporter